MLIYRKYHVQDSYFRISPNTSFKTKYLLNDQAKNIRM